MSAPLASRGLRRTALVAFAVSALHVVFGAVVRISGSGMGCADSWPKCRHPNGQTYWFPPLDHPQIVIEWTHRLLAIVLLLAVAALVVRAWRERSTVLAPSAAALGLGVFAAVFGAVTVVFDNPAWATAVHKLIAAGLVAALVAAAIRAGAFGAARLRAEQAAGALVTAKTARAALVAAGLTLAAVLMGALTAKTPDAAIACRGFPLCGEGSLGGGAQHIQLTHRVLAYLLAFHVLGLAIAVAKRGEARVLVGASRLALGVVILQILLAVGMLHTNFTVAAVRSLHQATGMALWAVTFGIWYLARGAGRAAEPTRAATRPLAAEARA